MSRRRSRRMALWTAFGLLWLLVLGAVLGLSREIVRLSWAERNARHAAAIEENLRLSLWRLDSMLSPLVAQQSLLPALDQVPEPSAQAEAGQSALPKVALPVAAAFRFNGPNETQTVRSTWLAGSQYVPSQTLKANASTIALQGDALLKDLDAVAPRERRVEFPGSESDLAAVPQSNEPIYSSQQNRSRAINDRGQRSQNVLLNNSVVLQNTAAMGQSIASEPLTPLWSQNALLLVRRRIGAPGLVEGWLIDWDALRLRLKETVLDLLPEAEFRPVELASHRSSPDALVTLPVLIVPGGVAGGFEDTVSDQGLSVPVVLGTVWLCVLSTAMATGWLLASVLRWSDRREAFVAAVTHELRTPLTSLQLYTEMLSTGMAKDDATRNSYLQVLQSEVERIGHLVENVFAFARLERGGRPRHAEPTAMLVVLERIERRLVELTQRHGMELEVGAGDGWDTTSRVDASMVEQILINLVDNACKHAKNDSDPRVVIDAKRLGQEVHVSVRDFGPGIPQPRRYWSPFFKSVEHAAETVHGIGLGLAISQRFAKSLGGRLEIENLQPGARVTLVLNQA